MLSGRKSQALLTTIGASTYNTGKLWIIAVPAALAAAWTIYQARGTINNDGVLYISAAAEFLEGRWAQSLEIYNWPLYSLLIAATHKLTGFDLQLSAHLLTIIFFSATSIAIATLARDIGGLKNTLPTAGLLLCATPYLLGDIVPLIIRDHGFWAFYTWSIVYLLRYIQAPRWKYSILWGVTAIIAILFRIEGITYIFLAPLVLLAETQHSLTRRFYLTAKANLVLLTTFAALVVLLTYSTLTLQSLGRLGEPITVARLVMNQLTSGLSIKADEIAEHVLGSHLDEFGVPILILGMVYILLAKSATAGGLLQTLLTIFLLKRLREALTPSHIRVLIWFVSLGVFNAAAILTKGFVLPTRMLIPIGLIFIVTASIAFSLWFSFYSREGNHLRPRHRVILSLLSLLLVGQLVAALRPSSPEISYEKDAVQWAMKNAGQADVVYYETVRMAYYGGKRFSRRPNYTLHWDNKIDIGSLQKSINRKTQNQANATSNFYFVFLSRDSMPNKTIKLTNIFGEPRAVFDGPSGKKAFVFSKG